MVYLRILFFHFLLSATLFAQPDPSLTPTVLAPNNPTVQEPVQPAAQPKSAQPTLPMQWASGYGGSKQYYATSAIDPSGWERLWNMIQQDPPQKLSPTEMAVIIQLGERPTGGYSVKVLKGYPEGNVFYVEWAEEKPSSDSIVTMALTQPWVIAVFPKSELPVNFKKRP